MNSIPSIYSIHFETGLEKLNSFTILFWYRVEAGASREQGCNVRVKIRARVAVLLLLGLGTSIPVV